MCASWRNLESMNENDFDTAGLARFLHISPQQVDRLISRQELPGRKIGGEWRFSRAAVHHWLEERLGVFDDLTLARMEAALEPTQREPDEHSVTQLLRPELIRIGLRAKTRNSVIRDMVELAEQAHLLWDPPRMIDAIRSREDLMSTAMDNGVAILHPRRPLPSILAEPFLALGISIQGIPFGGSRRLTDIFFLRRVDIGSGAPPRLGTFESPVSARSIPDRIARSGQRNRRIGDHWQSRGAIGRRLDC